MSKSLTLFGITLLIWPCGNSAEQQLSFMLSRRENITAYSQPHTQYNGFKKHCWRGTPSWRCRFSNVSAESQWTFTVGSLNTHFSSLSSRNASFFCFLMSSKFRSASAKSLTARSRSLRRLSHRVLEKQRHER